MNHISIPPLPPSAELESLTILKRLPAVHRYLEKHKVGRFNYYVNRQLFDVLLNAPEV